MFSRYKPIMKKNKLHKNQTTEHGSMMIDELSCIVIMGFVFAMIFAYTGYSKMVQTRLSIDNIAKEYLYQMEQVGYLSNEMEQLMTEDLYLIGVDKNSVDFSKTSHRSSNQAAYGDIVTLNCTVTFNNPLYDLLSAEKKDNDVMFAIIGLDKKITYNVNMSATAKW